jgi:cholesterol oxidase
VGKPVSTEHVDAVVVGSGFGGSVAAYRLAEAGRSVVLLERGRAYPPGSFARTPREMSRAFWDPSEGLYGMYDVWRFGGFDSLVSSGLGGGSLIYANVLLRKDERWFVHEEPLPGGDGYEHWPLTRADLDPHYDAVEKMIGAVPYPLQEPAYRDTLKTRAFVEAASKNGLEWQLPPLAVSFAAGPGQRPALGMPIVDPEYGNIHGVARRTCRLTGECDIGCNDGAKNSLDHTYLSAASHHGADIRTRCEVRTFRPLDGGGYEVAYVRHDPDAEGVVADTGKLPTYLITCDRLILGAGAYGTTFLLLRNRSALPGLSQALGTRFSGNGDLLTFLLPHNPLAPGRIPSGRELNASYGPVITSAIRVGDVVDGSLEKGRGFYIQDGGYPGFTNWLVESADLTGNAFRFGEFLVRWLLDRVRSSSESRLSREVSRLLGDGTLSAGSLPLLAMGRDVPDGVMKLRDGLLDVSWTTRTSEDYFGRVRYVMRQLAETMDAKFVDNPIWFFRRIITVHPLGGAPMGRDSDDGVCDSFGEVYNHPGLYVADGAAMPGAVGANPSLTIAAHADRMATRILEEPALPPRGSARTPGGAKGSARRRKGATSLSFTEEMKGFFAFDETDPNTAAGIGRAKGNRFMFHLTITADDVDAFLASADHPARTEGWIRADVLGGRRSVQDGTFNLFTMADSPRTRFMLYRLHVDDAEANPLTLVGRKEVHDDPGVDIWPDTSTLYYQILQGHVLDVDDPQARVVGAGVLQIQAFDFARQLTTFRTRGPRGAQALNRFGRFFLGQLSEVYLAKIRGSGA